MANIFCIFMKNQQSSELSIINTFAFLVLIENYNDLTVTSFFKGQYPVIRD